MSAPTPAVSLREKAERMLEAVGEAGCDYATAAEHAAHPIAGMSCRAERNEAYAEFKSAHEALAAFVGEALSRVERAEAALKEATTPDICGDGEDAYHEEDSFDGLEVRTGQWVEVWANRTLGQWFAARVVTVREDDEHDEEDEIQLFPTREAAIAAIAASVAPTPEAPNAV